MTITAITTPPAPTNDRVCEYVPGSVERQRLQACLAEQSSTPIELPMTIGGSQVMGGGVPIPVVQPHDHRSVLGELRQATAADTRAAISAALKAGPAWAALPFDERAAVFLRAAELLSTTWRDTLNAATMLGQSKSAYQAEIDSACELTDFWRWNVHFARQILATQPASSSGVWNRTDYRPLEGFVLAVTPFNFTAIAGNLPAAPAIMGNAVVWKPSVTQQLSAHHTMRLLEAAGLPPGVINMVTGEGADIGRTALSDPSLAGVHFTGSTHTFQTIWRTVADHLHQYRSYPRLVGETGGKDFVLAHPSADPAALVTALIRGAFDYQGQKCSAASRAYIPRSLWDRDVRDRLVAATESIRYGDIRDFTNFGGAVIDRNAFDRLAGVLTHAASDATLNVLTGGRANDAEGYFVQPTVIPGDDPTHPIFREEHFGPILAIHIFDDANWEPTLRLVDDSPYGLTGAVFAADRSVIDQASNSLRHAAGNFYINDKPTGAVVGQQPFGGGRQSGTNDKAGSQLNLLRWTSPRSVKESFTPATQYRYAHMG